MGYGRILIVDDDPDITEAIKMVLETEGYSVESASDGTAGLEHIKKNRPDLVILDVMMNTIDEGFVLSRELKSNPRLKSIPILMITSIGQKTGIDFEEASGDETWLPVDGFLSKPVEAESLLSKVKTLLHEQ